MKRSVSALSAAVFLAGVSVGPAAAGPRILFVASNETANATFELYTMGADASGLTRITFNSESEWSPAMAPDDYRIAYVRPSTAGSNLFVTTLHGATPVRVPNGAAALAVQWADADTLYYLRRISAGTWDRQFELWRVDTDGTGDARVYTNRFKCWNTGTEDFFVDRVRQRVYVSSFMTTSASQSFIRSGPLFGGGTDAVLATDASYLDHYAPALSPDGTRVAYAADLNGQAGSHRLYNGPAAGGAGTQVSDTYCGNPSWAPTGGWLAFTRAAASTWGGASYVGNIWRVNANGSGATNLTQGRVVSGGCAFPTVYEETAPRITRIDSRGALDWDCNLTRAVTWVQKAPAATGAWSSCHFASDTNAAALATAAGTAFYRLRCGTSTAVGHYPLAQDANDALGLLRPMVVSNAPYAGGAVYCNGVYSGNSPTGCLVYARTMSALNLTNFVISAEFMTPGDNISIRPIFVGGTSFRWAGFYIAPGGTVGIMANNFATLRWGSRLCSPNVWHEAVLVYRGATQTLEAYLDGEFVVSLRIALVHGEDRTWSVTNRGNGNTFLGHMRNVRFANLR